MKTCPNCQMTTDSHSECLVCGCDITDIPHGDKQTERYVLGKHFFKFLFKKRKFQLICILVALASVILTLPSFNAATFGALLLSALCLIASLYKSFFVRLFTWKYSDDYLETRYNIYLVWWGVLTILLAVLSVTLKYAELIYQQAAR